MNIFKMMKEVYEKDLDHYQKFFELENKYGKFKITIDIKREKEVGGVSRRDDSKR